MVLAQGVLGYGLTSVMGAIPVEIFEGKHFGSIYGTIMLVGLAGGALAPWITGVIHDVTGVYSLAWWLGVVLSGVSAFAIWQASPRKIRVVAGRMKARQATT